MYIYAHICAYMTKNANVCMSVYALYSRIYVMYVYVCVCTCFFLSLLQYFNFILIFFQLSFSCKQWEKEISLDFSPSAQSVRQLKWVSVDGQPVVYNNNFISAEKAFHAANTGLIPKLDKIPFPDPQKFVVGQVHVNKEVLGEILIIIQLVKKLENGLR